MVKRAFSLQLNKILSVEVAHGMSLTGKLNNAKDFKCVDKECNIQLTCTNWATQIKNHDKRLYFTPSSKENLHISGCYESGHDEEKQRSSYERKNANSTIQKNGLVVLQKISESKTVKNDSSSEKEQSPQNTIKSNNSSNNSKDKRKEGSHVTSILTLIEMYNDSSFDNTQKLIKVSSNNILSLDEFFINLNEASTIVRNQLRIYNGKAKLSTFKKNTDMIKIEFCNSLSLPPIFTNKDNLFKSYYGKIGKKYIDTNTEINVYFRGHLGNKWCSYNGKFYKDIYFSK